MENERFTNALKWLSTLLDEHHIPYQVIGGMAAQAYGATRPVFDIDLYVPMEQMQPLLAEMKPYMIRPPLPRHTGYWDLTYMVLDYHGVQIEIADSSTNPRFFNHRDQRWDPQPIDYAASHRATLFGVEVNVMPLAELVSYKARLDRDVDHADLQAIDPSYQGPGADLAELSPVITLLLDPASFDRLIYDALVASLESEGFRFTTMAELGNTEEAQRRLYVLNDTTAMEMAGKEGGHAWDTFEDFQREVCQMDWYKPAGQIVAIDIATGDWVAMSAITRFEGSGNVWNLFTGVDRRYHGRGLEQAVLALAIEFGLEALHADCILADESRNNLPVLAVYEELGYVQKPPD